MSKQSLNNLKSINQKDNRRALEKLNISYSQVKNVGTLNNQQDEVARFAQNTLREQVDKIVFAKSKEDREFIKVMKSRTKHSNV